jgi:hypothetical protein
LWQLWASDEIDFAPLGPNVIGASARRAGPDIRVNVIHQNDLPAIALNLAHEAGHLVRRRPLVEEEMLNRTLQASFYRDLTRGVSITSRETGGRVDAVATPATPGSYATQCRYLDRGELVDYVIRIRTYRDSLTAAWIRNTLSWWGGCQNRWHFTRGHYIRVLATDSDVSSYPFILDVMESVLPRGANTAGWTAMMQAATSEGGTMQHIRKALDRLTGHHARRVAALERDWNVTLH